MSELVFSSSAECSIVSARQLHRGQLNRILWFAHLFEGRPKRDERKLNFLFARRFLPTPSGPPAQHQAVLRERLSGEQFPSSSRLLHFFQGQLARAPM